MICKTCGKEIDENAYICINCGTRIQNTNAEREEIGFGIKLLCLFVPFIGIVIYLVFRDKHPKDTRMCLILSIVNLLAWFVLPVLLLVLRGLKLILLLNKGSV